MSQIDFNQLEKNFRISLDSQEGAILSLSVADLTVEGGALQLIETYGRIIKAPDTATPAAAFCGWFAFLVAGFQYALSTWDAVPDMAPGNVTVQLHPVGDCDWFSFQIHPSTKAAPGGAGERAAWQQQVLREFYADTVRPFFACLAKVAKINVNQLWGQLTPKLLWSMDAFYQDVDEATKQRAADDYQYLKDELRPDVFGMKRNPFRVKTRKIESLVDPDQQVCLNTACCLLYRTADGDYCYACPRLKEEEREIRRKNYRAAVGQAT